VSQIADACGYPTPAHFQRQFHRHQKRSPLFLPQRGAVAGIRRLTESAGKGGYYDGKGDCLKVAVIVQDGQHSLDDSPHLPYLASRLVCSEIHTMATDPVCSGAGLQQLGRE